MVETHSSPPESAQKPVYLPPGVRRGELPPFHHLGEYIFQDLCRDLLDADPDVVHCDHYGLRGQSQHGIDLLAPLRENAGYDLGQCKCYQSFSPADIRAASDAFLKYWARWSELGVRRFILFVACDVSGKRQQDEIIAQRERLKEKGVEYAVWSAAKIRNLLRPHRGLVASYFTPPDVWVREICGPDAPPALSDAPSRTTELRLAATESMLGQLAEHLSGKAAADVERLRNAWREGRAADALEGVSSLKADTPVWSVLSPQAKARVLRLEASLVLDGPEGLERGRALVAEARSLAPSDDHSRIEALITLRTDGAAAALALLGEPSDADARHLAAALLIDLARATEALEVLDVDLHGFEPSAETFRLQALAHAAAGDLERARLGILRALEMAPSWEGIRSAVGIIEYLSALSPGARPKGIPPWPLPPGWSYVQRDDESLARLRQASERFASLSAPAQSTVVEQYVYETWELASLANDPERQEKAALRCRTLLETNPSHPGAVAWALGRSYDIDQQAVEQALTARIENEATETQPIISLAMCRLAWDRPVDAISLLDATRLRFEAARQIDLWAFWRVQAAVGAGEDAGRFLEVVDADDKGQLELLSLRLRAERSGEWGVLASALESEHERTGYAPYLFEACLAWARGEDWAAAAERAERLVSVVGTAEAVRFAAVAAQNARRTELAVRLLDENRGRFPHNKLPHELRSLRTRALYAQGELSEAVAEARELARDEPILVNQMRLAQLLSMKGDLAEFAALVRQMAKREDLGANDALRLARTIAVDDAMLAIRLWRIAIRRGLPDEAVAPALNLAYRLGLDEETKSLMERMDRLAREGLHGNRVFASSELPAIAAAWNRKREHAVEAYKSGVIPGHLFADLVRVPLAVLYRHNLAAHERDPRPVVQFGLHVQHGMRALTGLQSGESPQWRLHADITALLLAAHLEILELVEESFGPIWIPDGVIYDLARMRDNLVPNQPRRLEHTREVASLADAGRIAVLELEAEERAPWAAELGTERAGMLAHAVAEDGYVLDYLPIRSSLTEPPANLPQDLSRRFVNARSVVDALRRHGPLSRPEQRQALRALGTEGREAAESVLPEPGRPLYCHGNTAELLASVGMLRFACDRFRVAVDASTLQVIRAEEENFKQGASNVRWLSALIEHLSRGQTDGLYRIIPPGAVDGVDEEDADEEELHGLRTLLRLKTQPGDAVWVGDRWSTGHWTRLGAPIVGIVEVLQAMLARGRLERTSYYDLLTQLRAGNVRFIPISAREIVHHLLNAQVDTNGVVETRALKILRRYTAACLTEADWLERPMLADETPNPKSEMPLLAGLVRAVTGAVWNVIVRGRAHRHERLARARWIMESLYVDHAAIRRCAGLATPEDDPTRLAAVSAVGVLVQGLSRGWGSGVRGRRQRRRYLRWAWNHVLRPRSDADRLYLPLVAEFLKNTPLFQLSDTDLPDLDRIRGLRMLYDDLPRHLREELIADPVVQAELAMETMEVVTVEGVNIERTAFIRGVAEAVNGRTGAAAIAGTEQEIRFERESGARPGPTFCITGADEFGEIRFTDDIFGILSESAAEREAVLRRNPDWFDGPADAFEFWIGTVASTEDPVRRFSEAESGRDGSPTLYYWKRLQQFRTRKSYRWSDLAPPPVDRLLRYFRIGSGEGLGRHFRHALAAQVGPLVADEGLERALERWAGLPIPLPSALRNAVGRLDSENRRRLVKRLLKTAGSPVSDLHLIQLFWHLRATDPALGRLALRRSRYLLNEPAESSRFETFRAVLRWTSEEFALRPDAISLPSHLRLALVWLHSHRLFALFTASAADMVRLGAQFRAARHRLSAREFSDDPEYQYDAAAPARVERLPFLLAGLSVAFAASGGTEPARKLAQVVDKTFFTDSAGMRLPHPLLLRDASLGGNALGSYLHRRRERQLRGLVPPERAGFLSSNGLRQFSQQLLEATRNSPGASTPWVHLWAVAGDLPLPRESAEQLVDLIRTTDFSSLIIQEPDAGGLALQVAAVAAARHPNSDVHNIVREAILEVSRVLAKHFPYPAGDLLDHEGPVPAARSLTQAAVELAKRGTGRKAAISDLAEELQRLISVWPALAEGVGGFAQRAWEELPSSEAIFFGDLVIRARSLA